MLITNLDERDILMNGAMGEIANIIVPEKSNVVCTVLVCFDSARVGEEVVSQHLLVDKSRFHGH